MQSGKFKTGEIYEIIFNDIIHGKYHANSRLKEEELAEKYNVSRTPIREAMRDLEKDGLIEIFPKRETRVIGLSIDDVEEIYEIRKQLEKMALRFSISHLSIQGLHKIRSEMLSNEKETDFLKCEQIDAKLHNYFIQASRKRRLISILNQMFRLLQRFRQMGFKEKSVRTQAFKDHIELIDALVFRDLEKAEEILEKHIERSKMNALTLIVHGEHSENS